MSFPPEASVAIEAYLSDIDSALPGLVAHAYVTGSVSHCDFRPEISDIDLVAVCSKQLDEPELDALADLHRPSRPSVDVLYVTESELCSDPHSLTSPYSLAGEFHPDDAFPANPVTWRELQTTALHARGLSLEARDVWFDPDALRSWNLENLEGYWQGQITKWREIEATEALIRHEYGLQWLVLGVPRLHYTIATLQITSKTGAGRYALELVDHRWHRVIEAAITLRAERSARLELSVEEARNQAVDLASWLIEDGHRLVEG